MVVIDLDMEKLYNPSTFDPRLISVIPAAVAVAAMKSGAAEKKSRILKFIKIS